MYRRIYALLASISALLAPQLAHAQSFADTTRDERGIQLINTESQSVYLSRIRRENDIVDFWMETSSGSFDVEEHAAYVASCVAPVVSAVGGYTYNYSMERIQDRWVASDPPPIEAVQPGSILQAAIEEACNFSY